MERPDLKPLRVMPWWLVAIGLVLALVVGWLVIVWLLGEADQGTTRAQLRIDAIRTGLTVVAGTGGAVALLLGARRQWLSERSQRHAERVAADNRSHENRVQEHEESTAAEAQQHQRRLAELTELDATERRVTELYTRAVDQLGSDRAAVRLGGLYALERLAQDHPKQRQTIVDIVCAYLRMPHDDAAADGAQEGQVRQTAQRLLVRHLRASDPDTYWPGVRIDLHGARLVDFDASGCTFGEAHLTGVVFDGTTRLDYAVFDAGLDLTGSRFDGQARLYRMRCPSAARFDDVAFTGDVELTGADLTRASFAGATFGGAASFDEFAVGGCEFDRCRFTGSASFRRARFAEGVSFEHATFEADADFHDTRYDGIALFRFAAFSGPVSFANAVFEARASFGRAAFHAAVEFTGARFKDKATFEDARATATVPHEWPPGYLERRLDDGWLAIDRDVSSAAA
jgi:uncharacterized protein YjbI with pentapeptide repeats